MVNILNLKLKLEDKQILNGICMRARKGDIIYIVGKNGCGKSTFFKALMGEYKNLEGSIDFDGKVAYQSQKPVLLKNMTVNENYENFRVLFKNKETEEHHNMIFKLLSLNSLKKSVIEKLSGGEIQRLALAVTLLRNRDIYLIDEADSALDPQGRGIFKDVIKYLKEQNKVVIFISHHLKESFDVANKCFVFNDGISFEVAKNNIKSEILNYDEESLLNYLIERRSEFEIIS